MTAAESALIERSANAFPLALLPRFTFPITSTYGLIIPGNPFTFAGFDPMTPIDLDNNGNPDCLDSFTGYNSVFAPGSVGVLGGCWQVDAGGSYAPIGNGLIANNSGGFGGDGFDKRNSQPDEIIRANDKISINLLGHFDVSDNVTVFGEIKHVTQDATDLSIENSFWDLLFGAPDNPFLPAFIQPVAQATGGVAITVDPVHFDSARGVDRDTSRAIIGLRGLFNDDWNYEISTNYGRFEQFETSSNEPLVDRWFAAIDAVTDPATGQPACRADVDPTAPPLNTPFRIPAYDAGYFSFTPGAGQCVPLNIWAGLPGITQQATDWVMADKWSDLVIEQFVLSAFVTGDSAGILSLPAGPVSFAVGAEYRDESSDYRVDNWSLGIIPEGAALPAGTLVEDVSENTSLIFLPQVGDRNEKGSYDAVDVYVEASIPLLADLPGARELTLETAIRFSDYSTVGQTTTWKTNLIYAPANSLVIRGSLSEAVRAPNINELFAPQQGTRAFVFDPCDTFLLAGTAADDPALAQQTQDNCVSNFAAIGLDPFDPVTGEYVYDNPNNAPTVGVFSGNPNLDEETATTVTAGFVFQPDFLKGFSLTVDYWDVSIEDAIGFERVQNLMDRCYKGPSLNPIFCQLLERNTDPLSPFFGGLNFFRETAINAAKLESSGYDITASYQFELGAHGFDISANATRINKVDLFSNPSDLSVVDEFLGEYQFPELAGNIFLNWNWNNVMVGWQSRYMNEQLLPFTEIESYLNLFGPSVVMDEFWQHDLSGRYLISDRCMVYGGIKNITDEEPFITEIAYPASARGRFFFVGTDFRM